MKSVILIGDSIRMGYQSVVEVALTGKADVWAPLENGGNSRNVLAHLDEWVISRQPAVLHINCGLHDLRRPFDSEDHAVPLSEYRANVRTILQTVMQQTPARVIWAATTPVNQNWHRARKDFDRFEDDVIAYNAAAWAIVRELNVAFNDIYGLVMDAGRDQFLLPDGVHFSEPGYMLLGNAVVQAIQQVL